MTDPSALQSRADVKAIAGLHADQMSYRDKRKAERLLAELPADTRDLTQRMMGDPLPGRSALAARKSLTEGKAAA